MRCKVEEIGIIKIIDKLGRVQIPKDFRDRLGLKGKIEVVLTKNGVLLRNSKYELVKRK